MARDFKEPHCSKSLLADIEDCKLARSENDCRGCGDEKGEGLVVCWNCFKYRDDLPENLLYKYFTGTLAEWLKAINAPRPIQNVVA